MTSLRKRQANRANALKSTGPKTPAGMRSASLNATSHGLSVATDPNSLDATAERVAFLIAADGIGPDAARELAAKIVDYERNMARQRSLSMEQPPSVHLTSAVAPKEHAPQESSDKPSGDTLLSFKMSEKVQKLYARIQRNRSISVERYLLRATNQLIKGLKRL